ncbi:protein LIFEGUARD 2-like [Wolffia australiana]
MGLGDVEQGEASTLLCPLMLENPQHRWAFIRKVYAILSIQLSLTVVVASVVVFVPEISSFLVSSYLGLIVYILIIITPSVAIWLLGMYYQRHPLNIFLLAIFTIAISAAVGLTCAFTSGKLILEAAILSLVVFIGLTLQTFWAAKRGQDFSFKGSFRFGALLILLAFGFIQSSAL